MSFDLYFLRRPENDDWYAAMETLEDNAGAERAATPVELELWSRVEARVLAVMPEAEVSAGESFRELTEATLGLQLFLSPGEIALSVPYWYEGDKADQIVALLRQVAHLHGPGGAPTPPPDERPRSWLQRVFGRRRP